MNPLTLTLTSLTDIGVHSISIDSDNRGYRVIRHEPYASNVSITETVSGLEDTAGNVVATASTTFTTRAGLDRPGAKITFRDTDCQ